MFPKQRKTSSLPARRWTGCTKIPLSPWEQGPGLRLENKEQFYGAQVSYNQDTANEN